MATTKQNSARTSTKNSAKGKVTDETTLATILEMKGASEVLSRFNLPCLHCPMAAMEMGSLKIGELCATYGIDKKKLLEELNKL